MADGTIYENQTFHSLGYGLVASRVPLVLVVDLHVLDLRSAHTLHVLNPRPIFEVHHTGFLRTLKV
jgi:hypothetical protein